MSSIAKTFLTLSTVAGIITSAIIVKEKPEVFGSPTVTHYQSVSPIIIYQNGTVRFLERIPSAIVATEIRTAARNQNIDNLNAQLIKHRFYVIPEKFDSSIIQ